jgi:AmmeMemoRadiSam system protein B
VTWRRVGAGTAAFSAFAASIALASILSLAGCSPPARIYSTWASLGEVPMRTAGAALEALPPAGCSPWAGTASHHLLADSLIDRWFAELSRRREVGTFFILSPSHWGLSAQEFSVTDGSWRVPGRLVESDRREARLLARRLRVSLEPKVFDPEHGVSTLAPYIAKYFPRARVVAIAYAGESPVNQPMAAALAAALEPEFEGRAAKAHNFLLVSTDFSHHGDRARTDEKDELSRRFFDSPSRASWIMAGCDNRPGIYALAALLSPGSRSAVLFHSDSLTLSGQGAGDITSYFFSFFWDP